jgi:hypothetical protein
MKVKVKEPLLRIDTSNFVLDVSHKAFKANPHKVYDVPDNGFWKNLVIMGMLFMVSNEPEPAVAPVEVEPETATEMKPRGRRKEAHDA